ncbi:MAG: hypothetical protein ACFFG0_39325 [Candidatus Thorarchaeota archaeon]
MGRAYGVISLLMGIIAIVFELVLAFVFSFIYADIIFYILVALAILFGIIGIAKDDSKGFGLGGLILGIVALVLWLAVVFLLFLSSFL